MLAVCNEKLKIVNETWKSFLEINVKIDLIWLFFSIVINADSVEKIKATFVIYVSVRSLDIYCLMQN